MNYIKRLLLISIISTLILNIGCKILDSGYDIRGYWTYEIFESNGTCIQRGSWNLIGEKSSGEVCTIPPLGESPFCYGTYRVYESNKVEILLSWPRREFKGDVENENFMNGTLLWSNKSYGWTARRW